MPNTTATVDIAFRATRGTVVGCGAVITTTTTTTTGTGTTGGAGCGGETV